MNIRAIAPALIVFALTSGAMLNGGCLGTGQCDALRTKLIDQRNAWASCDPADGDSVCTVIGGDEADCTGVLRCAFAVHVNRRGDAEKGVISNASQSVECAAVCSSPSCSDSTVARCDANTRRCVIDFVSSSTGGDVDAGDVPYDAGPLPVPTKDAGEGGTL